MSEHPHIQKEIITPGPDSSILRDDRRRWQHAQFGESRGARPEHWVHPVRTPGPGAYGKSIDSGARIKKKKKTRRSAPPKAADLSDNG